MAHACSVCQKSFPTDKHLHGHRTNSKLETCRECLYCDYTFLNKFKKQIRNHMKSKHSDIPCEMCNRKFFLTGGLDDHIRDVHCSSPYLKSPGTRRRDEQATRRGTETLYNRVTSVQHHDSREPSIRSTLNTRFLSDLRLSGNNLKRLLDEKVRQDPDKIRRCNEIVHRLVTFLQHNLECGVSEVVKGGSLGKGTSIKEKVDIDLVVFMNRFKSVADLQEQHKEVIKGLKKHILQNFTFAKQLHYNYDTKHSNRFGLRTDDGTELIQVDLLPACDIGGGSTSTFREIGGLDEEARSFYSVSFAKDQVRFIRDKPESVKDTIRLVKHWKTREKLNIPSYTVEIITSKEWERMGRPEHADLNELFMRTMTQLSDMGSINTTWSNSRATGDTGPIVMDPANPFNNTASMIERSDQVDIERKAREIANQV